MKLLINKIDNRRAILLAFEEDDVKTLQILHKNSIIFGMYLVWFRVDDKPIEKLDKQILGLTPVTEYQNRKEIYDRILKMLNKEAEKRGVTRSALWKIKKKIREGKRLNLNSNAVKIVVQ